MVDHTVSNGSSTNPTSVGAGGVIFYLCQRMAELILESSAKDCNAIKNPTNAE